MFLCSLRYCLKCYFSKGVYSFTMSTVYVDVTRSCGTRSREFRLGLARMWWYPRKTFWNVYIRDATIQFFRTDPIPNILRIGLYRFNPIPARLIFKINVEFLYFSVLTWSSLFCVLNSLLQCFSTSGSKVQPKSGSRIVYIQRNINKKRNSKYFSDAGLLF